MEQQTYFNGNALEASRYFKRFRRLAKGKSIKSDEFFGPSEAISYVFPMTLTGDMLLVEKLPKVELKTNSGIIIPSDVPTYKGTFADDAAEFGIVLYCGPGQHFEDGTIQPCFTKPGDVVLLTGRVDWYSQFGHISDYVPNTIGRVRDSDLFMYFTDYKLAMEILNEAD